LTQASAEIVLDHLDVVFSTAAGSLTALHDVSLRVAAGSFAAIVGPSGCGKSTLLRAVGGLLAPTAGRISVGGASPEQARQRRLASFVFQQPVLLPWYTAQQNIELPLRLAGVPRARRREASHYYLDLVGLSRFASAYPWQLSGGMQQRVAIARALATEPAVLLMDEPFGALDEITRERLNGELLRIWAQRRATVLFVTHSLMEAAYLADRVLIFSAQPGRLLDDVETGFARPRPPDLLERETFLRRVADLRRRLHRSYEHVREVSR
jgi:NitT/TauT family transport system ATP-binding protein